MQRRGYIIVDSSHPMHASTTTAALNKRAQDIISEIERRRGISIPVILFDIRSHATAGRSPTNVVVSLFSGGDHNDVRIIFTEKNISMAALEEPFAGADLLVSMEESSASPYAIKFNLSRQVNTKATVKPSFSCRAIEDLIVDIRLGSFFRQTEPINQLVHDEGLNGLFLRKAKFARKYQGRPSSLEVSKGARYAILSSLSQADDQDVSQRAVDAFTLWSEFVASISMASVASSVGSSSKVPIAPVAPAGGSPFRGLRKLGGQLPVRRIESAAFSLPTGVYALVVLRRASAARKSGKLGGEIKSLFGPRPRANRFRIFARDSYLAARASFERLKGAGFVDVIGFSRTPEGIDLNRE